MSRKAIILTLPDRKYLSAEENLKKFIETEKNFCAYNDVKWDENIWDITDYDNSARSHKQKRYRVYFTEHDGIKSYSGIFLDFAKAILSNKYRERGVGHGVQVVNNRGLRYIYDELKIFNYDPSKITQNVLNQACSEAKKREAHSSAYRVGVQIVGISKLIDRFRLTPSLLKFKNPIPRPECRDKLTETASKRREKNLPREDVLESLAWLSNNIEDNSDLILISAVNILLVSGFRIGELLTIPSNALVIKEKISNGKIERIIGLRFMPEKGGHKETRIKWFPRLSGELVEKSFINLKKLTEEARDLAKWYVNNPTKSALHREFRELEYISKDEILGFMGGGYTYQALSVWMSRNKVKGEINSKNKFRNDIDVRKYCYRVKDFEEVFSNDLWEKPVIEMSNGFRQELSESLFVIFRDTFSNNPTATQYPKKWAPVPVSNQTLTDFLCGRGTGKHRMKSVFERYDMKGINGQKLAIRSHQFRHMLTTIMNLGGLSEMELARWFGRSDIGHNDHYNHATPHELAREARNMILNGDVEGPLVDMMKNIPIVNREKYLETMVTSVHFTPYGLCSHDFACTPCDKHLNCLSGCGDYHIIKNDEGCKKQLNDLKKLVERSLQVAKNEDEEGSWGANVHVKHYETQLNNINDAFAKIDG